MIHLRALLPLLLLLPLLAGEHPLGTPAAGGEQLWERGDMVVFMNDIGEVPGTQHYIWRLRDGMALVRPELELQVQSVWSGDSRQLSTYVTDQVIPRQPALTVISTGQRSAIGPAEQAPDAAKFEAALREAIEKLVASGSEVIVLGTTVIHDSPEAKTPANELAATYNRICGEVARAANVGFVDLRAPCLEYLKTHPADPSLVIVEPKPVEPVKPGEVAKPAETVKPDASKAVLYAGECRYTAAWHDMVGQLVAKAIGERMAAVPMRIDIQDAPFIERAMVDIPVRRVRKGASVDIRYTLDGKDPTKASKKFEKPFAIAGGNTTLKVLAIDNATSATATAKAVFTKVKGKAGETISRRALGLEWALYQGSWSFLPEFGSLRPSVNGVWHAPELAAYREVEAYATMVDKIGLRFIGYIDIPVEGVYKFETTSDDGSRLWIDESLVVDNDGGHGMRFRSGQVALREGLHKARVDYFQGSGGNGLEVWWSSDAGIRRTRVPDSAWCYNPAKPNDWNPPPPKKEEPKDPKKDDPKKKDEPKKK
jgi:hypothetical protein